MCPRREVNVTSQHNQEGVPSLADEQSTPTYEAIMIGAGISGVFNVAEGLKQGFDKVLCLEKQHKVGGVWARLPAWQTVQNDPRDFCVQGFTTDKQTWHARDVVHMLTEYIRVGQLEPYLRLGREVYSHEWDAAEDVWVLKVRLVGKDGAPLPVGLAGGGEETYKCKRIFLCTGKHSEPNLPPFPKDDGSVHVAHSSTVHDFSKFAGKKVVVVGAGASGLDLLINTIKANEKAEEGSKGYKVDWLVREARYFGIIPFNDVIPLTILQLLFGLPGIHLASLMIELIIRYCFWSAGILHWLPTRRFNLLKEQLIPSRSYLATAHHRVNRLLGVEVAEVKDRCVTLTDGSVIEDVDAILMGTGYKAPTHDPKLELDDKRQYFMRFLPVGKHQGRLILFGEKLLDSTGSTPMSVNVMSRVVWDFIKIDALRTIHKGHEHLLLPAEVNMNHLDAFNMLAACMPEKLPHILPFWVWRPRMLFVHLYYRFRYNTRLFWGDRLIGLNMSLDG